MKWRKTKLIKYVLFLGAFMSLLLVVFFVLYFRIGADWGVDLPGGYSLSSIYGDAVEILDSNKHIIVSPNIEAYKVYEHKHIVIGHISKGGLLPIDSAYSVPGYFILNTESGLLQQGLEEKVWLDSLRRYGMTEKPRLHEPTGFDRIFR